MEVTHQCCSVISKQAISRDGEVVSWSLSLWGTSLPTQAGTPPRLTWPDHVMGKGPATLSAFAFAATRLVSTGKFSCCGHTKHILRCRIAVPRPFCEMPKKKNANADAFLVWPGLNTLNVTSGGETWWGWRSAFTLSQRIFVYKWLGMDCESEDWDVVRVNLFPPWKPLVVGCCPSSCLIVTDW